MKKAVPCYFAVESNNRIVDQDYTFFFWNRMQQLGIFATFYSQMK